MTIDSTRKENMNACGLALTPQLGRRAVLMADVKVDLSWQMNFGQLCQIQNLFEVAMCEEHEKPVVNEDEIRYALRTRPVMNMFCGLPIALNRNLPQHMIALVHEKRGQPVIVHAVLYNLAVTGFHGQ